jgi:RND family efflux transporter MFP subunit
MSTRAASQNRRGSSLLILVALACAPACRTASAGGLPQSAPVEVRSVRTAPVAREAIARPIRASGMVIAKEQATLSFKVGGVVSRILVQPGQAVTPGQVLATLDTHEIDAQVHQAELGLEKARRDSDRVAKLFAEAALPRQENEDAATALHVAEQNLAIARFNRDHAVIVSAGTGRVARRLVEPNAIVGPGTPVLQVNMASSGYVVRAGLIDRDFVRVSTRSDATVTLDAYPGRTFPARVTELAEEPSPLSGVYDVELRLEKPPPRLVSGLVAKVDIAPAANETMAVVPVSALVDGDGAAASVFTLTAEGTAHKVPVLTAFLNGESAAVKSGLDGVDRVVTDGASWLTEGARVREVAP